MILFLKELYLVGFVLLFRAVKQGSITKRAGRAVAVIAVVEWFLLLEILTQSEMFFNKRFDLPKIAILFFMFALFLINQYFLFMRRLGLNFEKEFNNLKQARRIALTLSWIGLVVIIVAFFFYTASIHRSWLAQRHS